MAPGVSLAALRVQYVLLEVSQHEKKKIPIVRSSSSRVRVVCGLKKSERETEREEGWAKNKKNTAYFLPPVPEAC